MQTQLSVLSGLVNQALQLDDLARHRLEQFAGKRIRLTTWHPDLDIVIGVFDERVSVLTYDNWLMDDQGKITTHLSGDFNQFLQLLMAEDKAAALINLDLKLQGESTLLIDLQALLLDMDIDWEFHLARVVGDVPAHFLGRISRGSWRLLKDAHPVFTRHVREFVTEEAKLVPTQCELDAYIESVQHLGQRLDRLEARFRRLNRSG